PGQWGVSLRVTVDQDNLSADVAAAMGVTTADLFNLTIVDTSTGQSEKYLNLTVKSSPREVDKVLEDNSDLLRSDGAPDATKPAKPGKDKLGALEEALATAQQALTNKQNQGGDTAAEVAAVKKAKKDLDDAVTAALAATSDGEWLKVTSFLPQNGLMNKSGLYALEQADLFNILCIPPYHALTDSLDVD